MKQMGNFNQAGAYFQYILEDPPDPWSEVDIQFAIARLFDQEGGHNTVAEDAWRTWLKLRRKEMISKGVVPPTMTHQSWKIVRSDCNLWVDMAEKYERQVSMNSFMESQTCVDVDL